MFQTMMKLKMLQKDQRRLALSVLGDISKIGINFIKLA
jgi:hypothetical protein